MEQHHAGRIQHLEVSYGIFEEFAHYTERFVRTLERCQALQRLRLSIDDGFVDLQRLLVGIARLPGLTDLHLDLSLRTDINSAIGAAMGTVFHRCNVVQLHMCMSDVDDDVMRAFLAACRRQPHPPHWREFHLRLKHNLITDVGAGHIADLVRASHCLERLYINLSYNLVGCDGRSQLLELPALSPLRWGVLKVDTDIVDPRDAFCLRSQGPCQLNCYTLSLAFTTLNDFDASHLGSRLVRLELDLEGCTVSDIALTTLSVSLGALSGSLEALIIRMVCMRLFDADLSLVCEHGIRRLHCLTRLGVYCNGNRLTDAGVAAVVACIPASVLRLTLTPSPSGGTQSSR